MQNMKFKVKLTTAFYTGINHNYDDNQQTPAKNCRQYRPKSINHNPWTRCFEPVEVNVLTLFPEMPLRYLAQYKKQPLVKF